jgi:hypothetical protein
VNSKAQTTSFTEEIFYCREKVGAGSAKGGEWADGMEQRERNRVKEKDEQLESGRRGFKAQTMPDTSKLLTLLLSPFLSFFLGFFLDLVPTLPLIHFLVCLVS